MSGIKNLLKNIFLAQFKIVRSWPLFFEIRLHEPTPDLFSWIRRKLSVKNVSLIVLLSYLNAKEYV